MTTVDTVILEVKLPPLEASEVFLKDRNPFGDVVELKGEHIAVDTFIFKPKESTMMVCGDKMLMKKLSTTLGEDQIFIFRYPEMTYLMSAGPYGNGADELQFPSLVSTQDTALFAYVFSEIREKIYKLDKQGVLSPATFSFSSNKGAKTWSSKSVIVHLGPNEFVYVDDSKTGKSIFRANKENDSIVIK